MTGFNFNPPKEFGDRSPVGHADLRSLENMRGLPFAKADIDGDTLVMKANGFNSITKRAPLLPGFGRYVCEGRFAGAASSTVMLAGGLRAPFRAQPLAVIGGSGGAMTLGAHHSLLATKLDSSGNITIYRASDLKTKTLEFTTALTVPPFAAFFITRTGHAAYYKAGGTVIEYETQTFMQLDGSNVLPKVAYSNGNHWFGASVLGYDGYDHYAYFGYQALPNLHIIAHAVVPRGSLWSLGSRTATPDGQVPYPLFQVSVDCGRSYTPIDLDYLFVGSTFEYLKPRVAGTVGTTGLGGYSALFGIQMQSVSDSIFVSLEVAVDAPSAVSIARSGYNFECRIFRSSGLDLTTMTQVNNPDGYGSVWTGSLVAAFAETSPAAPPKVFGMPGSGFGALGYFASAVSDSNPNMLHITFDGGTTWEPPRFLPAIGRWCVFVGDVAARELSCSVYEPTTPPQVVRYKSLDYGLTWQRAQIIAQGVIDITASGSLNDFYYILPINQDDGTLNTAAPMSGWRFDSRIPRYVALHAHL